VPSGAVSLALAASIYPPALAAVIALGRGQDVRLRVVLLVAAAYLTVLITGSLMLFLFNEANLTSRSLGTPSGAVYVAAGVLLLWLALRLRYPRAGSHSHEGPSRTGRYLQSRRLVVLLGVILYVVPSPIFVAAVKEIADADDSTTQELAYLVVMLLIMLWMIEVPMVLLVAAPAHGVAVLERVNSWFVSHGRTLAVLVSAIVGAYLLGVGLVGILT